MKKIDLDSLDVLLVDLEGTLFFKGNPIKGAISTIEYLYKVIPIKFLTNTDSLSVQSIHDKLTEYGFNINISDIYTPSVAAFNYLSKHKKTCFPLVSDELIDYLLPVTSKEKPNYVLIGDFKDKINYSLINNAFKFIMSGADILCLQKGKFFLRENGYNLDTGGFVSMFEYSSGKTALNLGKPSKEFFKLVLDQVNSNFQRTLIVGDDISSDIQGACQNDARSVLVKTGKYKEEQLSTSPFSPSFIIDSISDLPSLLNGSMKSYE